MNMNVFYVMMDFFQQMMDIILNVKQPKVQGIQDRCIFCNNTEEGGIKGFELYISDNGNIYCIQCIEGFILFENDNTCA